MPNPLDLLDELAEVVATIAELESEEDRGANSQDDIRRLRREMDTILFNWGQRRETMFMDLDAMWRVQCPHDHVWFARSYSYPGTRLIPPEFGLVNEDEWYCPYCGDEGGMAGDEDLQRGYMCAHARPRDGE